VGQGDGSLARLRQLPEEDRPADPGLRPRAAAGRRLSPIDVSGSIPVASADEFDAWLRAHGATSAEVVVAIFNRASGRQTVGFVTLQEVALCHGWVDTQTKRIDTKRYAIRFVPRRPRSHWSEKNRAMARRLIAEHRLTAAGTATLPNDL
jgi:uncharacterized protein YdeI (YjbR/CyaY-like superfamily)